MFWYSKTVPVYLTAVDQSSHKISVELMSAMWLTAFARWQHMTSHRQLQCDFWLPLQCLDFVVLVSELLSVFFCCLSFKTCVAWQKLVLTWVRLWWSPSTSEIVPSSTWKTYDCCQHVFSSCRVRQSMLNLKVCLSSELCSTDTSSCLLDKNSQIVLFMASVRWIHGVNWLHNQ